ncbi:guanylate cyclase [Parapedobacter defluvii]|uniref:Guanylate cyclase n=1 Tax=Parapedobacter defluvii TaxID=2045106 RepID=A0ABQ1N3B5_9SPHI|nr:adenylate/guanylate cyclase domain-containing protein [Parapedobacter defluvii]GGC50179.1 guanylate cyclase [Parapedobacter defluvii]
MAISDNLTDEISAILNIAWDKRDGTVIPTTDSVTLKNGSVKVNATFLYADLAGSSLLARHCPWETTAKIIRAYLDSATRLIRYYNGEIRSFDGDRVMGVFMDGNKNTNAVRCAFALNWVVNKIIDPKSKEKFQSIRDNSIDIRHCVGIDTGECVAVRAGIRNNNDLIWIGRPPSFAAKLSDVRDYPCSIFISRKVYDNMLDSVRFTIKDNVNMWHSDTETFASKTEAVYKTSYHWAP